MYNVRYCTMYSTTHCTVAVLFYTVLSVCCSQSYVVLFCALPRCIYHLFCAVSSAMPRTCANPLLGRRTLGGYRDGKTFADFLPPAPQMCKHFKYAAPRLRPSKYFPSPARPYSAQPGQLLDFSASTLEVLAGPGGWTSSAQKTCLLNLRTLENPARGDDIYFPIRDILHNLAVYQCRGNSSYYPIFNYEKSGAFNWFYGSSKVLVFLCRYPQGCDVYNHFLYKVANNDSGFCSPYADHKYNKQFWNTCPLFVIKKI